MFSLKRKYDGMDSVRQHLVAAPGLAELSYYAHQATAEHGKTILLTWWSSVKRTRFELTVCAKNVISWKLVICNGARRTIGWEHQTSDFSVIEEMLVAMHGSHYKSFDHEMLDELKDSYHDLINSLYARKLAMQTAR